ncbi:hypothetical protein ACH4U5_15370 [Streptomyces sp. NPDC020858]|uniref:hypothetical protein n=1 Tax=Streptomyces sp. NPDC020858 TaxID=3365097 RepID=UPI00378C4C5B
MLKKDLAVKMRALGRTGIQVNPYCPGTVMFGQADNPDHDDCVRIIHRVPDSGINLVDAADVSCTPPAITRPALHRRSADERAGVTR